jgi:inhibitor of KinA sporulation pathway (predicted exonuclease)
MSVLCRDCDIIVVIDVEATCDTGEETFPHEIIELPAVAVERETGVVVGDPTLSRTAALSPPSTRLIDTCTFIHSHLCIQLGEFQSYVRPVYNPLLSAFCTDLTGIVQADVETAPLFPAAMERLLAFVDDVK